MKLKLSLIALMVSLMAVSTFAATIDAWMQDGETIGLYNDTAMWKKSNVPVPTTSTGDEIKINGRTDQRTRSIATLGQLIYDPYGDAAHLVKLTVAGGGNEANSVLLKIVTGADAYFGEVRVGHKGSTDKGSWGFVEQTGGTLHVDKLQIGYHGSRTHTSIAKGYYTISGGTLAVAEDKTGRLMVGAGITSGASSGPTTNEGVFTVIGTAATITMGDLYVGTDGTNFGKGTLMFKVSADGVSAIQLSGTTLYLGGGTGEADLIVSSLAGASPNADIVLVDNQTATAIGGNGEFDLFNGGDPNEGRQISMGGYVYTLTYQYDVEGHATTGGNDIALLIPEPATLALLSLGLLTIRRKK